MIPDLTGQPLSILTNVIVVAELLLRIGLSIRIITRRLTSGTTLSWLLVVLALPFGGAVLYLFVGESRLGRRRVEREASIQPSYDRYLAVHRSRVRGEAIDPQLIARSAFSLADSLTRLPVLGGNRIELLDHADRFLDRLLEDIDRAERSVHLAYYIWDVGGDADAVAESVMRAARRGVRCRVAVDAVGSGRFLKDPLCARMREAGVDVVAVLPVGLLRTLFVRADLRNHRKIAVIDGVLGYTGSMNLADPHVFKQNTKRRGGKIGDGTSTGIGQWVDAMLRLQGPIVESLQILFLQDWEIENGLSLDSEDPLSFFNEMDLICPLPQGDAIAQLVPSGPGRRNGAAHSVLVSMVYGARHEVVLTTPYFVPDVTLQAALVAAAHRGVSVHLVVPKRVDSKLVDYASRAFLDELVEAGVNIHHYRDGLLHTKSITIDGGTALFGTLNLDPRSFWLNFELMLLIEDDDVAGEIRALQGRYMDRAEPLNVSEWMARPGWKRLIENIVQIFSPLL